MGAKFSEEDLLELAPPKKKKTDIIEQYQQEESGKIIKEQIAVHDVQDVRNVNDVSKENLVKPDADVLAPVSEEKHSITIIQSSTSSNSKTDDTKEEVNVEITGNTTVLNPEVASEILNNNPMNIKFNYRTVSTGQGKKGQKVKRINMSFTDDIYLYISTESRKRGMSSSVFVNTIIAKFMKDNASFD